MPVLYGDHPSQYAGLYLPYDAQERWPVVVIIHGGFWRERYSADLGVPLAEDLVRTGMACWNVEYRRVGTSPNAGGGGWPTTCSDVAAAVDALAGPAQRAAGGRLDLTRVVALGHSAGGHLAAWLATRPGRPAGIVGASPLVRITGVVSQAGVLDLAAAQADGLGSGAVDDFLGDGAGGDNDDGDNDDGGLVAASPIDQLPLGVPSICVHGTADDTVPLSQSRRFVDAAVAAGDASELVAVAGADHFDPITPGTEAWAQSKLAVQRLLGL